MSERWKEGEHFPRSCQHKAAVWRRTLSPNALYYGVLGKARVDEKDPDWLLL